jgi:hypothetical protein
MAVTASVPGKLGEALANAEVDFDTATVKVLLTTSAYAYDQDTHKYKSDVTNEVTGTGYTAGGATLATKTVTYTAGTNTTALDAADPSWSASTITARKAVFYIDTGTAATSPILCVWDFGADESSSAGTFTLQLNTSGLLTVSTA